MEEVIRESFRRVERERERERERGGGALAQHFDEENNEKFGELNP